MEESYYDNRDSTRKRSCFHCEGKLIPTHESDIINNILIQIYKCVDCGNETRIPEKPPIQTSIEDNNIPELMQERHDHPNA